MTAVSMRGRGLIAPLFAARSISARKVREDRASVAARIVLRGSSDEKVRFCLRSRTPRSRSRRARSRGGRRSGGYATAGCDLDICLPGGKLGFGRAAFPRLSVRWRSPVSWRRGRPGPELRPRLGGRLGLGPPQRSGSHWSRRSRRKIRQQSGRRPRRRRRRSSASPAPPARWRPARRRPSRFGAHISQHQRFHQHRCIRTGSRRPAARCGSARCGRLRA